MANDPPHRQQFDADGDRPVVDIVEGRDAVTLPEILTGWTEPDDPLRPVIFNDKRSSLIKLSDRCEIGPQVHKNRLPIARARHGDGRQKQPGVLLQQGTHTICPLNRTWSYRSFRHVGLQAHCSRSAR